MKVLCPYCGTEMRNPSRYCWVCPNHKVEECPDCNGCGGHTWGRGELTITDECKTCNGTGYLTEKD